MAVFRNALGAPRPENISPELVLVDPELGQRARAALVAPETDQDGRPSNGAATLQTAPPTPEAREPLEPEALDEVSGAPEDLSEAPEALEPQALEEVSEALEDVTEAPCAPGASEDVAEPAATAESVGLERREELAAAESLEHLDEPEATAEPEAAAEPEKLQEPGADERKATAEPIEPERRKEPEEPEPEEPEVDRPAATAGPGEPETGEEVGERAELAENVYPAPPAEVVVRPVAPAAAENVYSAEPVEVVLRPAAAAAPPAPRVPEQAEMIKAVRFVSAPSALSAEPTSRAWPSSPIVLQRPSTRTADPVPLPPRWQPSPRGHTRRRALSLAVLLFVGCLGTASYWMLSRDSSQTAREQTSASAPVSVPSSTSRSAASPRRSPPTSSKPAVKPPAPARPVTPPTLSTERRFAWPPVSGAQAYQFELFRDGQRVFARRTERPVLDLPARWRLNGRSIALSPGEYKWYVWPLRARGRDVAATVQATLVVAPQ